MDEQRLQAYIDLIQQLLSCPHGQEVELLQTHAELVDVGLLQAMVLMIENLQEQGNTHAVQWLQQLAEQLAQWLQESSVTPPVSEQERSAALQFLQTVLQQIWEYKGDARQIYPIWAAHQEQFNLALLQALPIAADSLFSAEDQETQSFITSLLNTFGNLIAQFPLGKRVLNLELAIVSYQLALRVRTREAFPADWAMTQNNLATAYIHRIQGDRADNLELAIKCCQLALQVYTREDFPAVGWAITQNNLATAYSERIQGNRADNLELAIKSYQLALQVRIREVFPTEWASTQNSLANAYCERIQGDRANNLELAIKSYRLALQVRTRRASPEKWAITQNNLATAYSERIQGNRADNLELAIKCCQLALQVYTHEDFPADWAMTQNNLANAYKDRIQGDQADNIELAIKSYQLALQVYTREDFPEKWAMTQNNLATAYKNCVKGDQADNIELAIKCCQLALQVYTHEDFPADWAMTQNNLANAYKDRIQGDQADNIELAIKSYQLALRVYTREDFPEKWATTQNNLATAYKNCVKGDQADNIELAIKSYQLALQVCTREDFPEKWATTQNNLANAYCERIQGDRANNLELAIKSYRLALQVRTPEALPIDCLQSGRNLGNLAFTEGQWQTAIIGYSAAIAAVERSRSWATDEDRRREIQAEAIDVYEKLVQACVSAGQLDKALETVERSRSKRLVDLMASHDLYQDGNIPAEIQDYLQQHEALQQRLNHLLNHLRCGNTNSPERSLVGAGEVTRDRAAWDVANEQIQQLEQEKQAIRRQLSRLDPVSAGLLQVSAPDLAAMQQLVDSPTVALLSFYTTHTNTYIFILRQNQITCHTCTGQGLETLQQWLIDQWLTPYVNINATNDEDDRSNRRQTWLQQILSVLAELSQRLQINTLIQTHLQGIEELIFVPHLFLHQIPFAALPTGQGCLGDLFNLRYVPSCQVLQFCHQRPVLVPSRHGTVEDATEDLPCSNFEGEQIATLYKITPEQRLRGRAQATIANYKRLLQDQQMQVVLSSHHAQSRLDNPLESMLVLADGAITLGELLTPAWRLPQLSDVFLSCCETGLGTVQDLTDEILTLATGFLCAGARSVVSTLWAVDDLATAIFSILYHQYRQEMNRPQALQQSQQTLRQMTGDALRQTYRPQLEAMLERKFDEAEANRQQAEAQRQNYVDDTAEYKAWNQEHTHWAKVATRIDDTLDRLKLLCRQSYPFEHPIYWAAFVSQGLR